MNPLTRAGRDLLADMSLRTDKETSLLPCFLPSWCLVAIHDPQLWEGSWNPESLGSRLRRGPAILLPDLFWHSGQQSAWTGPS